MGGGEATVMYNVDVVFCIDVTESMRPYLDSVKQRALEFHALLKADMLARKKGVDEIRVRVVSFRDLGHEGPDAVEASRFYKLPEDSESFAAFVADLKPIGGGDLPESGLEALAVAIRSPWQRDRPRRRHVIVMCTDAPAHPLGKFEMRRHGQEAAWPTTMAGLHAMWGDSADEGEMELKSKRLLLFTPECTPWSGIVESWENSIAVPSPAGAGLRDAELAEVIDIIAGSI